MKDKQLSYEEQVKRNKKVESAVRARVTANQLANLYTAYKARQKRELEKERLEAFNLTRKDPSYKTDTQIFMEQHQPPKNE